jgi:hypothetical protein
MMHEDVWMKGGCMVDMDSFWLLVVILRSFALASSAPTTGC